MADSQFEKDLAGFLDKYFPIKKEGGWGSNMFQSNNGIYFSFKDGDGHYKVYIPDEPKDLFNEFLELLLVYLLRENIADLDYLYRDNLKVRHVKNAQEIVLSLCDKTISNNKSKHLTNIKDMLDCQKSKEYYDWMFFVKEEIRKIDDKDLDKDFINLNDCGLDAFPLIVKVSKILGYDFDKEFVRDNYIISMKEQARNRKFGAGEIGF